MAERTCKIEILVTINCEFSLLCLRQRTVTSLVALRGFSWIPLHWWSHKTVLTSHNLIGDLLPGPGPTPAVASLICIPLLSDVLLHILKQLTSVMAGAIVNRVSGLSIVTSAMPRKKTFSSSVSACYAHSMFRLHSDRCVVAGVLHSVTDILFICAFKDVLWFSRRLTLIFITTSNTGICTLVQWGQGELLFGSPFVG